MLTLHMLIMCWIETRISSDFLPARFLNFNLFFKNQWQHSFQVIKFRFNLQSLHSSSILLHYQNEKWHCRRHECYRRSTSVLVLHASSAESRSGNTAECRERCLKLRVEIRYVSIIVKSSDDESRITEANDFSHMKMVDTDNRINSMGNNIIFEVNSRGREYFQVLTPARLCRPSMITWFLTLMWLIIFEMLIKWESWWHCQQETR